MSAAPVSSGIRTVLDAPRGSRFSRPGATTPPTRKQRPPDGEQCPLTREQRLLAQMQGNPRVAYRQAHGQLPMWMRLHAARLAERDAHTPGGPRIPAPAPDRQPLPAVPRPRPAPDDGPLSPRPRREPPPLPRRRPTRPHSHRKPSRLSRTAWHLGGYTLAALTGALAHHLAMILL